MIFNTSVIFEANYNASEKIVVDQGGTSSGKTYSIIQVLFVLAMSEPRCVITVAGQDIPNLKRGAYRDAKNILSTSKELMSMVKVNETDRTLYFSNGSLIEFTSYDSEQDAKSGKRDYLFINEANGIPYNVYFQLFIRTSKRTFIDYNPTARFWVHDQLIGKEGVKLIISDHRHNPFISQEMHDEIEGIKDPELHKIYARGMTGRIEGLIYNNWSLCDQMPVESKKHFIGVDFGFTNDPTAIIEVALSNGELWLDEIEYSPGLTNDRIADAIKSHNALLQVVCDSAEPKSIQELRNLRVKAEATVKGKDSVNFGIGVMKGYKINVTRRSTNIHRELERYKWKVDKNGNTLNEPIDQFNHALDAVRYVCQSKLYTKSSVKIMVA